MAFGKLRIDEIETSTQTVSVDALIGITADGDKGDITVSGSGTVWSIDNGAVDTAALGGDITIAGKALLDDADAAAQRTTLGAEAAGTAASAISTHEAAADPHPGYALESSLATVATTGAYSDLTGTPTIPVGADATPQPLGTAVIGVSADYAREDHVHAMPSAGDVGADPTGTASSAISTHEAAADPHPGYALESSLGGAALLDVGTTTGTVAAGDDSRFTTDLTYTASTRVLASSTGADATLPLFTSTEAGLTPLSGGGNTNFLRADGTWAAPPVSSGTVTSVGLVAPTGFSVNGSPVTTNGNITLSFATGYSLPTTASQTNWDTAYSERLYWDGGATGLDAATGRTSLGLATVASTGDYSDLTGTPTLVANLDDLGDVDLTTTPPADGEALVYDSATGDWAPGAVGATAAGSSNEIQYNDGASGLAASADLTWDDTAKELGVGGDINLDDGGTYATTLQLITPTANRTISFPDATGTVGLVGGSSGQLIYNNAGAYAGAPNSSVGATGDITLSLAGAASTPPVSLTGTWFSGGTATTTKPQFLIEPTGTTSTAWSTSGTGLGINAASGFTGNLLDLQVNGTSFAYITPSFARFGGANSNVRVGDFSSISTIGLYFQDSLRAQITGGLGTGHDMAITAGTPGSTKGSLTLVTSVAEQRNGTNAQTYRLYNTYTDTSNYERAKLAWNSNVFEIGTEGAGTGAEQPVRITAATLKLPNLPTHADNAAAITGGLVAGDVYKTATGELRITV